MVSYAQVPGMLLQMGSGIGNRGRGLPGWLVPTTATGDDGDELPPVMLILLGLLLNGEDAFFVSFLR